MREFNTGYYFWCDYENFGKPIGDYICSANSIIDDIKHSTIEYLTDTKEISPNWHGNQFCQGPEKIVK